MTTWNIPVRDHANEQASYYEDLYHKLKSERDETAHRLNELDDANRILRTKCAQLEACKKKVINGEVDKGQFAAYTGSISKQDKSSYDDLFKAYDILQREHRSTIAKNKSYLQQIGKLKKEIQTLKLRFRAPRVKNYQTSNGEKVEVANADNKENVERASVNNVLEQLQSRLNDAEAQLSDLRSKSLVAEEKTTNEITTKLHLLESQHELDEARLLAQTEKLERILNLQKEYKERYRSLKKRLDKFQDENELLKIQVTALEECKEQVTELNRFLEDKMMEMCRVAEHEEEKQRVRILAQHLEDKKIECELPIAENKDVRERTTKIDSEVIQCIGDVPQKLKGVNEM